MIVKAEEGRGKEGWTKDCIVTKCPEAEHHLVLGQCQGHVQPCAHVGTGQSGVTEGPGWSSLPSQWESGNCK